MEAPDLHFMKLALREARKGIGRTSPNPAVGAVVVRDGDLVGKGYHRRAGTPHAEVHALRAAGELARGATIYVTLEPCNHVGRTPPCTEAILKSGIRRVVVGMADPHALAAGGCDYLRKQGVDVLCGILEEECRELNRPFIKHVTTGLPWVIQKAGVSMDGRIATRTGHSGWITSEQARRRVHRLRDRVDAILVGRGTASADNPSLTTRLPGGRGKDPVRVVLDRTLSLKIESKLVTQQSPAPTLVFCSPRADRMRRLALEAAGVRVYPVTETASGGLDLKAVLTELGRQNIQSVLVEGGGLVHAAFLAAGLVDEVYFFIAPLFIGGDGVAVVDALGVDRVDEGPRLHDVRYQRLGDNILLRGRL